MIDIKKIRENSNFLRDLARRRWAEHFWQDLGLDFDSFYKLEAEQRQILSAIESLRTRRNQIAEEFPRLKKAGQDTSALSNEIENLKKNLAALEEQFAPLSEKLNDALLRIPNFPDASVPEGKSAEDNVCVRQVGEVTKLAFKGKQHWEIGEKLGILDFTRAGKLSGARFSVLRGAGAKLERALIQFLLDTHSQEHGYTEVFAPYLVTAETLRGTGQLPKFAEEVFALPLDGLYLIPTAEVTVTNLHRDETLDLSALPLKYACYSACFRREAGSYGKDTKGLIRNHQFNKVELVWFTTPDQAAENLESLTAHAGNILEKLKIPYRVMALSGGDLGFSAAKTYDLEVWMPGEERWREISSCSNFTDFQARRMNIKFKNASGKKELVYTLNGSGVAVGRLFAAILENYQEPDGSVRVPEALQPYLKLEKVVP